MELKDYFSMLRRWAWLLALGLVLGAMAGVLGSVFQTPIYESSTRILVLRAPQEKKPLRELPQRQREAFSFRVLEELDVATTARAMGCSEGSVKTHLFRAREALQKQLEDWR